MNDFSKNFRLGNYDKLSTSIRPEYYNLFQNLARVKEGVSTLVKLRADLLQILEQKCRLLIFLFIKRKKIKFFQR